MSRPTLVLSLLLLGAWAPARVRAQSKHARPDSAELHKQARNAQAAFERVRRRHMPFVLHYARSECDERIGRICLTHDDDDDWTPMADPPELVRAREALLQRLAELAAEVPADSWILGQRVYYLAEANRWEEAAELASRCAWDGNWWCLALLGFSDHGLGKYGAALEAFQAALERMPPGLAERWRSPELLLDGDAESYVEDRPEALAAIWMLADPLYVVDGNDRLTEHYARWVMVEMKRRSRNPWAMAWGRDLEELTIRYGWERAWERIRPAVGSLGASGGTLGRQVKHARELVPPGFVLEAPGTVEPGAWVPEKDEPRSSYAPVYAPFLLPGEGQVAAFPRGDTFVLVGATRLPDDEPTEEGKRSSFERSDPPAPGDLITWRTPPRPEAPPQLGMFLVSDGSLRREARLSGRLQGTMSFEAPAGDYLVSLEAWSSDEGRAGRMRHGISVDTIPEDLATLSDLLLLRPRDTLPTTLADAVALARPTTELTAGERVAVGWELFGLGWEAEEVEYELSLSEAGRGFFSRVGRLVGLGGDVEPLSIRWSEPGPYEPGPQFRALNVDLPEVGAGDYVLRLRVSLRGREPVLVTRPVRLAERAR